jgi:uncharacterized protein YqfB (UPF0267 family)
MMKKSELIELFSRFDKQLVERTAELRAACERVAVLSTENVQLRQLNADWAHQASVDAAKISQLKAHTRPNVDNFVARCQAYCAEHRVRSVPAHVAREFRS